MYIRRQLLQKKVVDIGVGTFAVVPASAIVGEDKVLPVERPVFELCRPLKKFYKLKRAKTKIPDKTLSAPLDFQQIAADIHFHWEIVEQCVHETLLFFAGALLDNKEVEFFFQGIGILAVQRKAVCRIPPIYKESHGQDGHKTVRRQNGLLEEAVDSPTLESFDSHLDRVLTHLI
ncbi:coiled-coil domain-containing protein 81-like [Heliangelus exortis]|uniref:coiled-coil domain-containing protein 81-like n=1 Tax=Heliangelus exortis TaxID=472823 RepID=UPI003A91F1DE